MSKFCGWYNGKRFFGTMKASGLLESMSPCENQKGFLVEYVPGEKNKDGKDKRWFGKFAGADEFFEFMMKFPLEKRNFFEKIISPYRKMIFDIDVEVGKFKDLQLKNVLESSMEHEEYSYRLLERVLNETHRLFPFDQHRAKIYESHAKDGSKLSFHVIIDEKLHYQDCKNLMEAVTLMLTEEERNKKFVDPAVYGSNQSLRMLGNCKHGTGRIKNLITMWEFDGKIVETTYNSELEQFLDSLIGLRENDNYELRSFAPMKGTVPKKTCKRHGLVKTFSPDNKDIVLTEIQLRALDLLQKRTDCYGVRGIDGNFITLNRVKKGYCEICQREHDSENGFMSIMGEEHVVILFCYRQRSSPLYLGILTPKPKTANPIHLMLTPSDLKGKVKYTSTGKYKPRAHLLKTLDELTAELKNKKINPEITVATYKNDGIHCPEVPLDPKITSLTHSQTGTGKTQANCGAINARRPKRCLFISSRICYSNSMYGELMRNTFCGNENKEKGLPHWEIYKDVDGELSKVDYLICQVDSLHRLKLILTEPNLRYDLVICDELESILAQFSSETLKLERKCAEVFEFVTCACDAFIGTDGYICERSINVMKKLRDDVKILYNPWKRQDEEMLMYVSKKDFLVELRKSLSAGRKVYFGSGSKTALGKIVESIVKPLGIEYITYTGDTSDKIKKGLADVNEVWVKYNFVGVTPTVTIGTNFDVKGHFDEKFLYATPNSFVARDFSQQGLRDRYTNLKKTHVFINNRYSGKKTFFTDRSKLETHLRLQCKTHLHVLAANEIEVEKPYEKDWYHETIVQNYLEVGRSRSDFVREFIWLSLIDNYKIQIVSELDYDDEIDIDLTQADILNYDEIPDIDFFEYVKIDGKIKRSQAETLEKNQHRKYFLTNLLTPEALADNNIQMIWERYQMEKDFIKKILLIRKLKNGDQDFNREVLRQEIDIGRPGAVL